MGFPSFHIRFRRALRLGAALLAFLGLALAAAPSRAAEGQPASPAAVNQIYIPLTMGAGGGTQPPPPPPPPATRGAFFVVEDDIRTISGGSAVDAKGGLHMVFSTFTEYANHPRAIYAYCPGPASACADPNSWKAVALSDLVDEVQLQLTPAGQPRLLITKMREGYLQDEYVYAECDVNCTEEGQWRSVAVVFAAGGGVFDNDNPQRSFALDPQGRPRFIFSNGWGAGYPEGVYYAYCDDACTDADNWYGTQIYQGPQYKTLSFDYPALKFTRDGSPRVIANVAFTGESQGVSYLACDTNCGDISGWEAVRLYDRGGGVSASWDLELDANDRPRVAFYQAGLADGSGDRLYYAWCNTDCLAESGWRRSTIGLGATEGQNADLALDQQGRPRMAYKAAAGLGYAWCNVACESGAGQWQRQVAETSAALQQDFAVAWPVTCDPSFWTDPIPSLSLDPQGNPRIAYDNLSAARCYYQKPGDPNTYTKIEKLWRAVRWLHFQQP
jgi:hypothetical protein